MSRAWVLTGGGVNACRQVGMMNALSIRGKTPDALFGVSGGAKNAFAISRMANYFQNWETASLNLMDLWLGLLSISDLLRERSLWSRLKGLLGWDSLSLYSSEPLKEILRGIFQKYPGYMVDTYIGAVNLNEGKYQNIHLMGNMLDVDYILASSSMPGYMPPVTIGQNELWMDGGARNIAPLADAIGRFDEIYVLCATHPGIKTINSFNPKGILDVIGRFSMVMADEIYADDLKAEAEDKVRFLLPSGENIFDSFMDIDPSKIRQGIREGVEVVEYFFGLKD